MSKQNVQGFHEYVGSVSFPNIVVKGAEQSSLNLMTLVVGVILVVGGVLLNQVVVNRSPQATLSSGVAAGTVIPLSGDLSGDAQAQTALAVSPNQDQQLQSGQTGADLQGSGNALQQAQGTSAFQPAASGYASQGSTGTAAIR